MNGRRLLLAGRHWVPLFLMAVFLLMLGLRYVMELPELSEGVARQDTLSERHAAVLAQLSRDVLLALLAAALLWAFLDAVWFRRARRMVAAVEDMGAGQLERRTGVGGADELGLIGQAVDRMAERLQHNQRHLQYMNDLINRSPAVVVEWHVGAGWPVLRISDGVSQWGYVPVDFTASGRMYRDFVHPDDLDGVMAGRGQCFSGHEAHFTQAYRIRRADGGWAWVEDRTRIERDGQGALMRATGILLDITDRRMAERARQEREDLVRRFFELPFIGMAISSAADKRWLEVNGRLCDILGYEREQLLDRTWVEMTHPDDVATNLALFDELVAGRRDGYQMDKRFIHRDGTVVHTEMAVRAVHDVHGQLEHLFTTIRDVSERKAAQEALTRSEALLREVQRIGQIGSWEYDLADGRHMRWSEEMYRIHDIPPGAPLPDVDGYLGRVHPQERQALRERLSTLVDQGGSVQQAYRLCMADGRIKHAYLKAEAVLDQGRVRRLVGMVQDMTDLAEMRSERDRLALVLESSTDVVAMARPAGAELDVFYVNRAGRALQGVGPDAPVHDMIRQVLPVWAMRRLMEEALPSAQRHGSWTGETAVLDGRGEEIPMSQLVIAHCDLQGRLLFFSTILRDISAHKRNLALLEDQSHQLRQAEERLFEANQALERRVVERTEQLRRANQELEAFTYSVSHDLKAPLRGIDGYSQLLQEEYAPRLDEEGRLFVARIRRSVEQMGCLIEDLLDYSRMERRQMAWQDVDVRPLAEQALEACAGDIERLGTQVDNRVGAMRLSVDREGLAVALRNLIGNAVKFSRDSTPPRIEIGAEEVGGCRRIWVRDNGIGFDMKYCDRIFGIFQRLHRVEDYAGTGVGLALVAKAVERMNGRVRAESAPGQGAVFYLEFPSS